MYNRDYYSIKTLDGQYVENTPMVRIKYTPMLFKQKSHDYVENSSKLLKENHSEKLL